MFRVICAWCQRVMEYCEDGQSAITNSHGICPACQAKWFPEANAFLFDLPG